MGRKRCVRAIARTAVTVVLVAVVFLILGESRPARADWTKFTASSPWCQGTSGCPTLEASCENAADYMSGFNGSAPDDAAAIQTLNYYQARCLIYNLPPYGTTWAATENSCPSGNTQMLWADTGCVPYYNTRHRCDHRDRPGRAFRGQGEPFGVRVSFRRRRPDQQCGRAG